MRDRALVVIAVLCLLILGACGGSGPTPPTPPAPTLSIAFSPNPAHPNPNDLNCGQSPFFCWTFVTTVTATEGALTVTSWQVRQFDSTGASVLVTNFAAADFQRFFGTMVIQPGVSLSAGVAAPTNSGGGVVVVGGIVVFFGASAGGRLDISITCQDSQGQALTFTSGLETLVSP